MAVGIYTKRKPSHCRTELGLAGGVDIPAFDACELVRLAGNACLLPRVPPSALQLPTQNFFTNEFGLPLTMKPNFEVRTATLSGWGVWVGWVRNARAQLRTVSKQDQIADTGRPCRTGRHSARHTYRCASSRHPPLWLPHPVCAPRTLALKPLAPRFLPGPVVRDDLRPGAPAAAPGPRLRAAVLRLAVPHHGRQAAAGHHALP